MSWLQDGLKYLVGLDKKVEVKKFGDLEYSSDNLFPVQEPLRKPIKIATLNGLVDYIKNSEKKAQENICIIINNNQHVGLYSRGVDKWQRRIHLADVNCSELVSDVYRLKHMDSESFVVSMLTKFKPTDNRDQLIQVASKISKKNESTTTDDGISQSVTVDEGLKFEKTIKNPVVLKPVITFPELDQPDCEFIFRVNGHNDLSLHIGDMSQVHVKMIMSIKKFLNEKAKDIPVYY